MREDGRLWELLRERGIRTTWLAEQAAMPVRRLYELKGRPGKSIWREDEMEAVARALGKSRRYLFGPAPMVRGICIACGKQGRVTPLRGQSARGVLVPRRQDQATGDRGASDRIMRS